MSNVEQTVTPKSPTVTQAEYNEWGRFYLRQLCRVCPILRAVKSIAVRTVWLRFRCTEAKKAIFTDCASVCFRLHRRFHTRTNLFGRWAGGCLMAAQRYAKRRHYLLIGISVCYASIYSLSVEPDDHPS